MTTIDRIKKISKEKGWSLQKVAEKAGIGINSIYRWNTKTPSTSSLQAVAKVLDVSVDYLLGKEDSSENMDEDVTTLQRMAKEYTPEERKRAIEILKLAIDHERGDH